MTFRYGAAARAMMTVCVTGGTGFLGSHVCRALLDSDSSLAVRDKSRHELVNPLLQACADAKIVGASKYQPQEHV